MKNAVTIAIVLISLWLAKTTGSSLREFRHSAGITDLAPGKELTPGEFVGTVAAGPVRVVPVMLLFVQAMDAFKQQDWHRALTVYGLLAQLTPRVPSIWMLNGWNMAVNIAYDKYQSGEPESAYQWIKAGLDHIAEGAERNPRDPEIRFYYGTMLWRSLDEKSKSQEAVQFYRARFEAEHRSPQQESIAQFDRACEMAPNEFRYQDMAWKTRRMLADRALAANEESVALDYLKEATPYIERCRELVAILRDDERISVANRAALSQHLKNLDERQLIVDSMIEQLETTESVEPSVSH